MTKLEDVKNLLTELEVKTSRTPEIVRLEGYLRDTEHMDEQFRTAIIEEIGAAVQKELLGIRDTPSEPMVIVEPVSQVRKIEL